MRLPVLDDAHAIAEVAGELAPDERCTQLVEHSFVAQRVDEPRQTFLPGVVAEIVESCLLGRLLDRALGVEILRGHRTSARFTTSATGVSTSPSGRKNRQNTMPKPRPSVSIQFATPGSSCAMTMN